MKDNHSKADWRAAAALKRRESSRSAILKAAGKIFAQLDYDDVTPVGSDRVALKLLMTNAANLQTVANTSSTIGAGNATLQGVEALAQQFVKSLSSIRRFSKENCDPANPWMGTMSYRKVDSRESKEERKPVVGEGTVTSTTSVGSTYEATMRIGWTGEPKVRVSAKETNRIRDAGKIKYDCGTLNGKTNWKSFGFDDLTVTERTASAEFLGSVSVTLANKKIKLEFRLPEIEGVSNTKVQKKSDGRCDDKPTSSAETFEEPWRAMDVRCNVEVAAGNDAEIGSGCPSKSKERC